MRAALLCATVSLALAAAPPGGGEPGTEAGGHFQYLLVDRGSGRVIESRWPKPEQKVAFGSLVKPFTALAYAQSHRFRYPESRCSGGSKCWLPAGHGNLGIQEAIAHSCNAYFAEIAVKTSLSAVRSLASRFGLSPPPIGASPGTLYGLGNTWRHTPQQVMAAYEEVLARAGEPGVQPLLQGMARAGQPGGTGEGAGQALGSVLVKTGTSPCNHAPREDGDGAAIVFHPLDSPRFTLLVRAHGVTGRQAAELAGRLLARIGTQVQRTTTAEAAP